MYVYKQFIGFRRDVHTSLNRISLDIVTVQNMYVYLDLKKEVFYTPNTTTYQT